MEEEYRIIEGFENYEVSNLGNIRNIITKRILSHQNNGKNYSKVNLITPTKCMKYVHRLIAMAFIPNPENKCEVDHIDRNRQNNIVLNLRWATKSENQINRKKQVNNTSKVTGVNFDKHTNKWLVRIHINGKEKNMGLYKDFDEAVKVRKEQEEIHYKEFRAVHVKLM